MKFPNFFHKTDENGARVPMTMRAKLGWILVGLAALVAYGVFRHFYAQDDALFELNRTLVILFLLWLAWPELESLPRWLLILVPICAIVCAWRPQYLVVVIPITLLYLFIRPPAGRRKKKTRAPSATSNALTKKNSAPKK